MDALRDKLLYGIGDPAWDPRDVVFAGPSAFWFRAEVVNSAAGGAAQTECVGYYVDPQGAFVRAVGANWRNCPDMGAPAEVLIEPPPAARIDGRVFTYDLNWNPNARRGATINPADCTTIQGQAGPLGAGAPGLAHVVGVNIELSAWSDRREAISKDDMSSSFALRLRQNRDYRQAIACAS